MVRCKKCDKYWDNEFSSKEFKSCCPHCGYAESILKEADNAKLIVKAPEMYELLKACSDRVYGKGINGSKLSLKDQIENLLMEIIENDN